MQTIRCAACGRRYDYRQEGCCPRCGAYNRPPRREWVGADGSVHHGEGGTQTRLRPGKVCYEEKVCFEEQTRKPRKKAAAPTAQGSERVVKSFQKPFKIYSAKGKKRNRGTATTLIAFALIIVLLAIKTSGQLDNIIHGNSDLNNGGWSDSNDDWDSNYRDIDADCGDTIDISDDLTIQFLGYLADEDGQVYLFYNASDSDLAIDLLESGFVLLSDGTEDSGYPADEVADGYIDFQTYSPGTQWQDLLIYGSTAGDRITIGNLYPIEEADGAEYGIPTDASLI